MPITPSHLRPGNWIHKKGTSRYGVVNGDLLALLEKDEKLREQFEYIELNGELLEAAGFEKHKDGDYNYQIDPINYLKLITDDEGWCYPHYMKSTNSRYNIVGLNRIKTLDQLQNLIFVLTQQELPLPESAKIIPEHAR